MQVSCCEKRIVIVIPSYNNEQWFIRNIESAVRQKYSNYRIVYIDDCSTDATGDKVEAYVAEHNLYDCVHVIHNEKRRGALANLYHAIHACSDDIIIVTFDGDDWFETLDALSIINMRYQDPEVWMTYGQFKIHPDNKIGFCRALPSIVIQKNIFREYQWITSHPRTFYAGLFKQIQYEDLLYEGNFFEVTWDQAFMFPMLEMAREHVRFIPEILYVYNEDNELNDFKQKRILQVICEKYIHKKKKYDRIDSYVYSNLF